MGGSDREAVAGARAGDTDAFRALVDRYSRKIFRLGYRMTSNEHDAEDVVQETFLRAYRALDQFESRADFGTWIFRIAANAALDLMRKRQRHEESRSPLDPAGSEDSPELPSADPTPERLMFSAEVKDKVTRALAGLSAVERTAFVLRHFEGMSIEEIGNVLDLKESATKNTVFRAVQKLRRELAPFVSCGEAQ
ncbi:MAG TPA: sigma-70 family RNA polymerase sigma factor [Terriglobia bacterium]|nr:sigma-70 family RNA polymerase sigma factor [Terriglobia bacterium]